MDRFNLLFFHSFCVKSNNNKKKRISVRKGKSVRESVCEKNYEYSSILWLCTIYFRFLIVRISYFTFFVDNSWNWNIITQLVWDHCIIKTICELITCDSLVIWKQNIDSNQLNKIWREKNEKSSKISSAWMNVIKR